MRIVTPGPTRKNVFKEVSRLRSVDADVLKKNGRLLGAAYLLGYSIECYLKFAACERNGWERLPEKVRLAASRQERNLYVHDWPVLVEAAGIARSIQRQRPVNAIYSALCRQWGPELRYRTARLEGLEGENLYNDLLRIYEFLKRHIP
jgi:hypothetical protein